MKGSVQGRVLGVFLTALVALQVAACGDSGGAGPSPVAVTSVVNEGSFSVGSLDAAIASGDFCVFAALIPFTTSVLGDIEVTVDWTDAANDIDLLLIDGECMCRDLRNAGSADALNGVCPPVAQSTSDTAKPERMNAPNRASGNYTVVALNFGAGRESCSYQVTLTSTR